MTSRAASFNVLSDFGPDATFDHVTFDPYVIIAVIRLGMPLSFSRKTMTSVTTDVTAGGLLRAAAPLVITDDCLTVQVHGDKRSHTKNFVASLKQTTVNYLNEILPGDWIFAWMVNNLADRDSLLIGIETGRACNDFKDGLKFLGRAHSIRKQIHQSPDGMRTSNYTIQGVGFSELDSMLFYDNALASKDQEDKAIGSWMARLGLKIQDLFGAETATGIQKNNTNVIIPTLLDLIVGKGPPAKDKSSPAVETPTTDISGAPQTLTDAPFAYLVPVMVGKLLGIDPSEASKASHVVSYADILELLQGVQQYNASADGGSFGMFIPELDESSSQNRRFTKDEVLGTYLPFFPEFTNRPLYQILQQYCNPAINETYTALRVNPDGRIMPTLVFRQIPFTTEAFQVPYVAKRVASSDLSLEDSDIGLPPLMTTVTRFLSLPRWAIPPVMITALDVGRSDATRTNFVHVYGASSLLQNNVPVQYQMVNNPPRIDHLDVQRSGMRSYSATVECWVDDQVGKAPAVWMDLVADRMIGSQYTLNGTLHCFGIQSPIAEGDNTEIAGVAFHIESVAHNFAMHPDGKKTWSTSLTLTNGMRAKPPEGMDMSDTAGQFPMYAGFAVKDLTEFDPGLTAEHDATTGGVSDETGLVDDREKVELTVSDSFIDYGQLPNEDL